MAKKRKNKLNPKYHPPFFVLVLISIVVIGLQIVGGILVYRSIDTWADRASFGDMFGAIGTLFSGLAFAGVIYTILLQIEELKRSAKAQAESEKAITEQAKALAETARLNALTFLPAINCRLRDDDLSVTFVIQNPSNIPAFDIDITVISVYSEDELDIPTFLNKYIQKKEVEKLSNRLIPTDEGFYGVSEHLFYPMFPQKQQNSSKLMLPIKPDTVYCLVQFRDIKGANYHQVYWFFHETSEDNQSIEIYRLGNLEPVVPIESKRIGYELRTNFENTKSAPGYLIEFFKFLNSSIYSGYLKNNQNTFVEDRGKWETI